MQFFKAKVTFYSYLKTKEIVRRGPVVKKDGYRLLILPYRPRPQLAKSGSVQQGKKKSKQDLKALIKEAQLAEKEQYTWFYNGNRPIIIDRPGGERERTVSALIAYEQDSADQHTVSQEVEASYANWPGGRFVTCALAESTFEDCVTAYLQSLGFSKD